MSAAPETAAVAPAPKELTLEELAALLAGGKELLPTQREFLFSPVRDRGVKAYVGVLGCAKTTTGCIAGVLHSLCYPGNVGLVGRLVEEDLRDTTQAAFMEVVHRVPGLVLNWKSGDGELTLAPAVKGGAPSRVLFRPVFDEKKLGSLKLGWFLLDEASEHTDERIVHTLVGRLGRLKMRHNVGFLTTNPPSRSHWFYRLFEEEVPDGWLRFRAGAKENAHNLPDGYYEDLAKHYPTDMRRRLIEGEYGSVLAGKPVYGDFREGLHVSAHLKYNHYLPMLRGWDFGFRRPGCVWAQIDPTGNLNVLAEELGHDEDLRHFAKRAQMRSEMMFPNCPGWEDYCDPAGAQVSDKGETSVKIMIEAGIVPRFRVTRIEEGLAKIRKLIGELVGGRPAIQLHPGCKILVEGMLGGYRYPPEREGKTSAEVPWKDGFFDHLQDSLRYIVVNVAHQVGSTFEQRKKWSQLSAPPLPRNSVTGY